MTATPGAARDLRRDNEPAPPAITGLHHLTIDVQDLEASISWYGRVLGASHLESLDHYDDQGLKYAVIIRIPGLNGVVQLRGATDQRPVQAGYDPVTFEVADRNALEAWTKHFDSCAVRHSAITRRRAGDALDFSTPDGLTLRLYTTLTGEEQKQANSAPTN